MAIAQDRDVTALFEAYHPLSKTSRVILAALEITTNLPPPPPAGEQTVKWDWRHKFIQDIRDVLSQHLEKYKHEIGQGRYANGFHLCVIAFWAFATLAAFKLMLTGSWLGVFLFGCSNWMWYVNTFHDASHFALTKYWWINRIAEHLSPYAFSPIIWDFQHVIAHHNLPNTDDDPNDQFLLKIKGRKSERYRWGWIIKFTLMCLGMQLVLELVPWVKFVSHNTKMMPYANPKRRLIHFFRPAWYLFTLTWPYFLTDWSGWKCFAFAIIPWIIKSLSFATVSQVSHLQPGCHPLLKDGASWYSWQCLTTTDYGGGPWYIFWPIFYFSGGVSLQIEHHLFPGINSCQLPRLCAEVERVCTKHQLPYRMLPGLVGPLKQHIEWMASGKDI